MHEASGNPKVPPSLSLIEELAADIRRHIRGNLGYDPYKPDKYACYMGLAYSLRDRLIERWIQSQRALYETTAKRVYFLSLEFLPGRFLKNYLVSLQMEDEARAALQQLGFDLDELEEEEWDAGLGNGGLGRLASCYMDSMACCNLPCYGYGIRYDYGIFHQVLEDGYQRENCDNWLRRGNPWEILRRAHLQEVRFYGRSESYVDEKGRQRFRWVEGEVVMAMACDILIPGYGDEYVTNMRLWIAQSSREFNLAHFNQGDYMGAMQAKVLSENISKVLYPSDEAEQGKMLRLKQQYFFVAATLRDIIRRYKKQHIAFAQFPDFIAIQLNETHPAIAIPDLMRILMDEEDLDWEAAWEICENTFAYTNHTVLPEALETWPEPMIGALLPRHLEIIREIDRRLTETLQQRYPGDTTLHNRLRIIQEGAPRQIRMSHLAIVGSHSVNGVAALHSHILKTRLFREFNTLYPNRFKNVTNGITQRRWLWQANPRLSRLISSVIGEGWVSDLGQLADLTQHAEDPAFRSAWMDAKLENKRRLARYIFRKIGMKVNPWALFDVQVKRIHEYKRQLLNILHVVTLYNRLREAPDTPICPRAVIFAGKAAPAYHQAKLIIKLITSVADRINGDSICSERLRVLFLPNYCVSQAEKIIPATDLSEQISTAGLEASGTGNMKMALNGALTIGTLDGATIEIMEQVGRENMFIFGMTADEVADLRAKGYNPGLYYDRDPELKKALDMIASGYFAPNAPGLFEPIVTSLLQNGDYYMVLADYRAYISAQEAVDRLFMTADEWARRSILNTAHMGIFSSDRAIREYADEIWHVGPVAM